MLDFVIVTLVFVVLYVLYQIYDYKRGVQEAEKNKAESQHRDPVNPEVLDLGKLAPITLEQVHQHDGIVKKSVYVAIKNVVFDVSSSDSYKQGGSYAAFAGQDVSISLGKMDLGTSYLNMYGKVVQPEDEVGNMNGWFSYFYQRYPVVGKIVSDKKLD